MNRTQHLIGMTWLVLSIWTLFRLAYHGPER